MWRREINKYWQLVLLRCPPFELQYSLALLLVFVFVLALLQWLSQQVALPDENALYSLVVLTVTVVLRCLPVLMIDRSERLVKTLLALLGADLIVQIPRLIGVFLTVYFNHTALISILVYSSLIWRFMVTAYIYQYALNISLVKSYLLAIVIFICEVLLAYQVLAFFR